MANRSQKDADTLNKIIKELGIEGLRAVPASTTQVNLFLDGYKPELQFPVPVAGCHFSECFTFLRGYKLAKLGTAEIEYED